MRYRPKDAFECEGGRYLIPISFIEEEMYYLRQQWLREQEPEKQDKLEAAYRVLDRLIQKWRKYIE